MGMLLHELATNATKHGALSAPEGRIELSWSTADGLLHLLWREEGGPPVRAPSRRGFGRQLVEGAVAHDLRGQAEIEFAPTGLRYRLRAPLVEIAVD
jgi:two-component sensor histidine kinase